MKMQQNHEYVYRVACTKDAPHDVIEELLMEAFFVAESIYGMPQVRMSGTRYYLSFSRRPRCIIETPTEVGECIVKVFVGFLVRALGEESIKVERVAKAPEKPGPDRLQDLRLQDLWPNADPQS